MGACNLFFMWNDNVSLLLITFIMILWTKLDKGILYGE